MKRSCRLVMLLCSATGASAVAQTYSSPESVEYHPRLDRYLIGNTLSGKVLQRAADGTLHDFIDGLQAPYGIELLGGTLFVLDEGNVKGFDIDSASQVMDLAIDGALFLNGIASDGNHLLTVSDFSRRTLHRIDIADLAAPVVGAPIPTGAATPNGLVYDGAGARVLIATWGGNADILSLADDADAPAVLIETALGNLDGIALDCNGAIVAAAWSGCGKPGGCLARFDRPFAIDTPATVFAAGLTSPADIDYNRRSGDIAVPEASANRVSLIASGCEPAVFLDDFER